MNQNTKDWIKLIALIFGTGAAVIVTSVAGGMKTWLAVLMGLGVAGTNVFHAMSEKPGNSAPPEPPVRNTTTGTTLILWLLLGLLCVGGIAGSPMLLGGCATPPARSAAVYYTFKDTWTLAHTAYSGWCERVVQGKIPKDSELAVDAAWNKFRAAFRTSLRAASLNWNTASPEELKDLANDLNDLIRQF